MSVLLGSFARMLIASTGCDEVVLVKVGGGCLRWNQDGPMASLHPCGGPCPFAEYGLRDGMDDWQEFPNLQHDPRLTVPVVCPTQSLISSQVRINGHSLGMLVLLYTKKACEFSDATRQILASVASVVAMFEHGIRRSQSHESEVLLRSHAIEKTPLSIYIKDADHDFRYVEINEFTCQRLGMTRDMFIGRNDAELFTPELAEPYMDVDRRAMESDGVTTFQQVYVDSSGEQRPVSSVRYPVTMPDGRRLLICYSVEISEFLARQREIEELQRRTAAERDRAAMAEETDAFIAKVLKSVSLFSENDSLSFVLSEIGKFVGADRSYIYMFKDPGQSGLCSNDYEWCAEGVAAVFDSQQDCNMEYFPEAYEKIMAGEDFEVTDVRQLPPMSKAWLEAQGIRSLIITAVKNQQGIVVGFAGFDFVTRKLDSFGWRIVHVLHEASDIISICRTRSEFYFAMRAAERAQSDFFASVSHDIRTPLNAIIGFSELLKTENDPVVRKDYLERISFSGDTLLALINDVLDLSRLDASTLAFHCVPFDFGRLLKHVACTFESVLSEKGVRLLLDIPDMPILELDEYRTRQVCFNLMGNAVKYTDAGFILVSASFKPGAGGVGELKASVSDSGIGISSEDIPKLMRPYMRIQQSTESRGGTGLGLSICKRIVEAFGGTISVASELGRGSTFSVTVPNVRYQEKSKEVYPTQTCSEHTVPGLSDLDVLVVDDLEMNRCVLSANCKKLGVGRVVEACSGENALALIDEKIGLVLCDMKMPGMDGAEFIKALHARPAFAAVPVVLVTADVAARKYAADLGAASVLIKPLVQDDLLQILVFALRKSVSI